jgi:hypothetical protein
MTSYLYERKVWIFDYPKFADPLLDQYIRAPALTMTGA